MKPVSIFLSACLFASACAQGANTREDFLKVIKRPRVSLAPKVEPLPSTNGLTQFRFSFTTEKDQRVPGILMKKENFGGRRPVVIALHGTSGSKNNMLSLCRKLANEGFIAVAIDGRYHGERAEGSKGAVAYEQAIGRAWREGGEHPFYYDTVWDVMRLVDYLKTRRDVDDRRIGLIGISKGGIETYLAAAVDKRIAAAVPCIAVQSFGWALENDAWQPRIGTIPKAFQSVTNDARVPEPDAAFAKKFYDRLTPGIYAEFDGPAMLPLIAPRPLLVINGDSDNRTPLPGVLKSADAARRAYQGAGVADRFELIVQEKTGHQVKPESERAAIDWFVKWLKP